MFRIYGQVTSKIGTSETEQSGWASVDKTVSKCYIPNEAELDGLVNVYQNMKAYLRIRELMKGRDQERFFLQTNPKAHDNAPLTFFIRDPLGKTRLPTLYRSFARPKEYAVLKRRTMLQHID